MSTVAATIDTYLSAWTEADPAQRAALIAQVWAADGSLTDPPLAAEGHDGISSMMAAFQGQFPGHRFRRASGIDAHHDRFRFAWELIAPDGSVTLAGLDVGELAEGGRLRCITGFFGPLPEETAA
jgi:hypothetical protein